MLKGFTKTNQLKVALIIGVIIILFWALELLLQLSIAQAGSITDGAKRIVLDNGFTIILKEDHSSKVTSVQLWVKTGSANETDQEAGITHLIEHMIFKGTPTRETGEIARTIESAGGEINAYTSFDRTVYYIKTPSDGFNTAVDILLDAVRHSVFKPEELDREKEVVLEEYRRSLDMPERQLSKAMMALCYKKHPYRRPIIGFEDTIRSFDRQAILNYMRKWYSPDNMVMVAAGDFDSRSALITIRSLAKDFPAKSAPKPERAPEPKQTRPRKTILYDDVQQAYLTINWHIPPLTHKDIPALDMLGMILGEGKTSRLYKQLKTTNQRVYSVDSGAYALKDPGLFLVDAILAPDKLSSVLETIGTEIIKTASQPILEAELAKVKNMAEADFIFDMESMEGQARTLGFFEAMTGDMRTADLYLEQLRSISSTDINKVAAAYLKPENLSVGILLPAGAKTELSEKELTRFFSGKVLKAGKIRIEADPDDKACFKATLPNGIRIIVKENHRLPLVSITGVLSGGTRLENPDQAGISNFTAKMLVRGTKEKSAGQIAASIEYRGGKLSPFSGRNSFGLSGKFLSKDISSALDLLADIIQNPAFPEAEMEKARKDIMAGIKAKKDSPVAQLFDLFNKTLYHQHPYQYPRTGALETIQALKRTDLVTWYDSVATPQQLVLSIVGDINKDEIISYLNTLLCAPNTRFFNLKSQVLSKSPEIKPEPALSGKRLDHLARPGAQIHMAVGFLGAPLNSPKNAPMALVKTALSGQGGRLFFELRDKQGLAYTVTALRRPGLETGAFGVYIACDPLKLTTSEKAILDQLERLRKDGLTEKELRSAKKHLAGSLVTGMQTNSSQSMQMALNELYGLGYNHASQFINEIKAVSRDDIKQAIKDIIVPEKSVWVSVGPKPKDKKND
jgi:zinc protease